MPMAEKDELVRESVIGVSAALAAYGIWGLLPIYWKVLSHISAMELMCHRVVWSALFLQLLLLWRRYRHRNHLSGFKNTRALLLLSASSLLIGSNWLIYIWAVNSGHVLETSLGYFINPLLNVILGAIFFRERLRGLQGVAVALAGLGVLNLAILYENFPWIALSLALTFGFYGLIRKLAQVDSLSGLWFETVVLTVPAIAYLIYQSQISGSAFLAHGTMSNALLVGAGVVTATPLLFFGMAAGRLRLSTLGFFQYLAPTLQFLLAVFLYREPFTNTHLITFSLIWVALVLYSADGLRARKNAKRQRQVVNNMQTKA